MKSAAPDLVPEQTAPTGPSRFEHRKEEILNAAGAVFNRHGLRDATLAIVAAEIGLNLKSLRYYFERRDDLVAAVFMRSIEVHRQLAQDALVESGIEARIHRFAQSYFQLQASVRRGDRPELVSFGDLRALTAPHCDVVWPAYTRMFKSLRELLRTQEVRWDRARLNASAHMLLSQVSWSVVWFGDYFPQDASSVAKRFSDILLHGIAAKPVDLAPFTASLPVAAQEPDGLSERAFLRTTTALINQLGYRGASVDRISTELNVRKGAFYYHNDTRDGLVVACFERTFALLREAQDEALAAQRNGIERVAAASVSLVNRQMLENGTLLRISALTALEPELRVAMAAHMSRLTLRFADMLNDGLIDGSARPCNVRIAAEMITATINSAEELSRWVSTATRDNAADLYVRPLLAGVLAGNA